MSPRFRAAVDILTTIAILGTCAVLAWGVLSTRARDARPSVPVPKEPVSIAKAASNGSSNAPIVMIEYSDYECPFCRAFSRGTRKTLIDDFVSKGQLRIVFKHHPLIQLHPFAPMAASAATCAGRHNRFWEMSNALFQEDGPLNRDRILEIAGSVGVSSDLVTDCLSDPTTAASVQRDVRQAEELGLGVTPAFLIGRIQADDTVRVSVVLIGNRPASEFRSAIEGLIGDDDNRSLMYAGAALLGALAAVFGVVQGRKRKNRLSIATTAREAE